MAKDAIEGVLYHELLVGYKRIEVYNHPDFRSADSSLVC